AETGAPDRRPHAEEIAEIVFTSGSTGDPKGVALTHRNIIANIEGLQGMIPRGPHYRLLSVLPLSHMLEQTIGLYLPLTYGATVYYIPGRQASTIKRAMVEHRITSMVVVVPQALDLFLKAMEREVRERGRQKQWQLAHRLARYLPMSWRRLLFREAHKSLGGKLDFFLCGGAYLPADLAAAWERLGVRVIEGYGSTECAPVVTCNSYDRRVISSVGRPLRNLELRAAEDSELQVRGPSVFSGYWKDEQATKEAFSDGWYCTGDLGHLDKNGYVHLKGRKKDLIVLSSGLNVYPEDVEDELKRAEAIHDCVVLGLPNPSGEIRIHAVVLPAPSLAREQLDEALAAAIQRANARLATHQRVKDYSVWPGEDFPRTNTLKVKRHEVRREIEADAK
ncbi:MAG TPA: AMP-binding protein, partial [Dehalococcoidia bacterium]|nr:AMP-binding protein [Dehalococcoidia bacterium]